MAWRARVERIGASAKANKQAIYLYYGGKEKLFGTVVRAKLEEICHAVELDPVLLPESAGLLFDWYQEHPELIRLLLWEALETEGNPVAGEEERREAYRVNVRAIRDSGFGKPDEASAIARRRAAVVEAVRRLTRSPWS